MRIYAAQALLCEDLCSSMPSAVRQSYGYRNDWSIVTESIVSMIKGSVLR